MKICIDDLRCRASVGVFDWEKLVRQNLILDVEIEAMSSKAVYSDELEDTINYKELSKKLITHVQSQHFGLIEKIAYECCQLVLKFDANITKVTIEVSKPGALSVSRNVRVVESLARNQVVIGIGSNIDPEAHITKTKQIFDAEFSVVAYAQNQRTKAIARKNDPDFINTAALIETSFNITAITRRLKHIEWEIGRISTADNYGKRIIDLDILLWNQQLYDADIISRPFLYHSIQELLPGVIDQLKQREALKITW